MISALHLLARRHRRLVVLPPPANATINNPQCYHNRYTRISDRTKRHLATNNKNKANKNNNVVSKSQKQARASKLRKEAKDKGSRNKGVGKNKKFKPSIPNRGTTKTTIQSSSSSSSSPTTSSSIKRHDALPKAPHMRPDALPKKDGFKEYIIKNPFIFAAFIFPTVTTGILILVKPNLRSQFFGNGDDETSNASVNAPVDTPAAVYEGGVRGSGRSAGGTSSSSSSSVGFEDGVAEDGVAEDGNGGGVVVTVEENDPEAETTPTGTATTTTLVTDLFYSIGIRPHPSS